jgi:predicted nuclease with TOPRIM domain
MNITDYLIPLSGVATIAIGVGAAGWYKILKETNALLKEQNAELKIANAELTEKHEENLAQLNSMQGQLDVLKSIPLVNIDTTLKQISTLNQSLAKSNSKILETLESSATLLIKDTKNAADKVEEVKEDLK